MFTNNEKMGMDRSEKERLILLGMTEELGRKERNQLERLLAEDEDARRLAKETQRLFSLARSEESISPASETLEAVKRAGRRELAGESRPRSSAVYAPFMNLWCPAVLSTIAALFLFAVAIPLWRNALDRKVDRSVDFAGMEWNRRIEEQLTELDEEVTLAMLEYAELADSDRDIDELAREYIEMEETEI